MKLHSKSCYRSLVEGKALDAKERSKEHGPDAKEQALLSREPAVLAFEALGSALAALDQFPLDLFDRQLQVRQILTFSHCSPLSACAVFCN